jgi:DNA-damage-inducible protein D
MSEEQNKIVVFEEKNIRRVWHNEEWWFVIEDVVGVLSESANPKGYVRDMRRRDPELSKGWGQIAHTLSVETGGGAQKMNCASTEGIFRIVQSIASPRAEPFKRWLAKVGYERVQEIENPELAAERARQYYRDLGYDDKWIETRIQSIAVRGQLTDEWKGRGVQEGMEYSILTAEISRATFGINPSDYKTLKGLNRENLRDHMTNLELIFTMLGEEQTKQEAVKDDAQGFEQNRGAAIKGGLAAGDALTAFEKRTGDKVVTDQNFKQQIADAKKQKKARLKKPDDRLE